MRLVFVAGGTGGHIYPGIAIARAVRERDPQADILFIGSEEGLEKELIAREGFSIKLIKSRALLRKLSYKAVSAPFVSALGFFQAVFALRNFSADMVVSTGGYASLPVVAAAWLLRVPVVLHEQNVLPGAVNRFCRRLARKVFLTFEGSLKYMRGEVVGNPVRKEIVLAERDKARQKFGLAAGCRRVVLVMGGSQGAKHLNETVVSALDALPQDICVLHIIGNRDFGWVSRCIEGKKIVNYKPLPYLHEMADALAAADLAVSRAGATAIAEFLVRGLPMVLVPFPYASGDHQRLNAAAVAEKGGAVVVEDKDFTAENFIKLITGPALDYDKMSNSSRRLARPGAAERIVDYIYG